MPTFDYQICDVFTDRRFGGNPLAVLPDARGLSGEQMQQITREFGFSETAFVLPAEGDADCRLRIFTPGRELPFAGHPNIGTAYTLARMGRFGAIGAEGRAVRFEQRAGTVAIQIRPTGAGFHCELAAPGHLSSGEALPAELIAAAIGLQPDQLGVAAGAPRQVSVGLPFVLVELADRATLAAARPSTDGFLRLADAGIDPPYVLVYARSNDEFDLRVRMFSPLDAIIEDPATGSANCALAAWLAAQSPLPDGEVRFGIAQGVEMGRPSLLSARVLKRGGEVAQVHIGGESVMFASGQLQID